MKILVSDLDNDITLLNNDEQLESIRKFVAAGNMFVIATDKAINYLAESLSFTDLNIEYFICNDGAVIFDKYYNVIYRKDLNSSVVRPIVNQLKEDDNILETFIDTSHGFVQDDYRCANGIVARPFDKDKAEVLLNRIVLKYPSVHGHVNDNWLNIVDIDVNKCEALNYLMDNYRLNEEDIYVIGQDINDLEMTEKFKSYVYVNGKEDLKKYCLKEITDIKDAIDHLLSEDADVNELDNGYVEDIEPYFANSMDTGTDKNTSTSVINEVEELINNDIEESQVKIDSDESMNTGAQIDNINNVETIYENI